MLPATVIVAALLWWRRLHRDKVTFLIAMIGTCILIVVLKLYFHRSRPDVPWVLVEEDSFSFPSGHSIAAVVLYGSLLLLGLQHLRRLWQRLVISGLSIGMIVGIGVSRIYLGIHYPSDVAAGYLVGCTWLATVVLAEWELTKMDRQDDLPFRSTKVAGET